MAVSITAAVTVTSTVNPGSTTGIKTNPMDQNYKSWTRSSNKTSVTAVNTRTREGMITVSTSIQTAAEQVPLTDASWEIRCRSGDLRAGPPALNLSPTTVPKLWTQRQKLLWRFLWRQQPEIQTAIRSFWSQWASCWTPDHTPTYLKKEWCSTQTFHSLFAALWFSSLKPMMDSNWSNWEQAETVSWVDLHLFIQFWTTKEVISPRDAESSSCYTPTSFFSSVFSPLRVGSWCRSCSFYTKSSGSLAKRIYWSSICLCRPGDHYCTRPTWWPLPLSPAPTHTHMWKISILLHSQQVLKWGKSNLRLTYDTVSLFSEHKQRCSVGKNPSRFHRN